MIEEIIKKYKELQKEYDFVLIEGLYKSVFTTSFDFDINLEIAQNLGSPFIPVIKGRGKDYAEINEELNIIDMTIKKFGCTNFATFINRVDTQTKEKLEEIDNNTYILEETPDINKPSLDRIKNTLNAECVIGTPEEFENLVNGIRIATMTTANILEKLEGGELLIFAGDRDDLLLLAFTSFHAKEFPNVAGILLTGGIKPHSNMIELLKSFKDVPLPVLATDKETYVVAQIIENIVPKITIERQKKINLAFGLFSKNVNVDKFTEGLDKDASDIITPIMFEYALFEKARENKQTIVLPESDDERILKAADLLLKLDVVNLILLGNPDDVKHQAALLNLDISKTQIIDPNNSELLESFARTYYELRQHKGMTIERAYDTCIKPTYFGTMMVYTKMADGMVSGANHTTADTVRPALEVIKTKPGIKTVSSVFFMCLDTKVLVYGDCAIIQDPTEEQLAEIAVSSADTAFAFGIDPKVALLSYSTGSSGTGVDVDKVKNAVTKAHEMRPELNLDGPMQYDAATVPSVAKSKMPDSSVAGHANVLVFPDLNTGNNTYKAVQRSSGAVAIGPVLQGLKKPVNDLSRGCLVKDIINTVAITAIQAQQKGE
jgi:phosphate acetyltransferase